MVVRADVNKTLVTILTQETSYVVVVQMYQDCRYQHMCTQTHLYTCTKFLTSNFLFYLSCKPNILARF